MLSNFCEDLDLENEADKYSFKKRLFFGPTGEVVMCINRDTGETVAIKLVPEMEDFTNAETKILRKIKALGSEKYNIVKFYEDFYYKRNRCLVFEKLDIDLEYFTELIVGAGLHLCDIRIIAQQVLVALDFLHSNGIAHRDIKPNNIMLVDRSSLKVKLIDMGCSEEIERMENSCANPNPYMPPEEIMFDKPDASLDMWCLALTLIYFYLKDKLFEYDTIEEILAAIVKMLGEPHCSNHFSSWKNIIEMCDPKLRLNSLDDLLEIRPATQDPIEREDLLSFIDFLKQMLVPTPQERITSAAALKHSFITMDHLSNLDSSSPYVLEAHEAMRTYKIMTPQRLGAKQEINKPEESTTFCSEKKSSPSGNNYCVSSGNYASPTGNRVIVSSPKDETETILTPFGLLTTDCATFWSEFFSKNDLVLESETSKYLLIKTLGFGGTSVITKCINQETGESVVIKLGKDKDHMDTIEEKKILNKIKALGSDNYNIVKFYEDFYYQTKQCLVFEKLDIDLEYFTEVIVRRGLHLCDIRLIAQQVLVALDFLHSNGIAHRDIKPNNIMLVDRSSLKVKLIDMGFSEEIERMTNICVNPLPYMPPEEILLDKPDASLDMWLLALTLIYFYLKAHLFTYNTFEETLAAIVKMLGEPHCSNHFSSWKNIIEKYDPKLRLNSLDDLLEIRPATQDPIEREDLLSFIDLLKQMLVPTPQERITSAAALKHNFITMDHLSNLDSSSPYVLEAHEAMRTYKFMTPQRLRAKREINKPEESTTFCSEKKSSPSGNNYCVSSGNYASPTGNRVIVSSPKDETETIPTHFGLLTTDGATFWSEFSSKNDLVVESETSKYLLIKSLGLGGTSVITECINQETGEIVVIKLGKSKDINLNEEKKILNKIKALGSDNYNIVKFYEDFYYQTKQCLVFEKLDIDLQFFTEVIVGAGLHLCDIRLIAQQVLVALDFLHSNGIAHRDIKPNNIMLVDRSSLKVKLIDMGFSEEIEIMENICVNPLPYMPPEEIMFDKPDTCLDMWLLALTLIYFYLQDPLFEYDTFMYFYLKAKPDCSKTLSTSKNIIKMCDPELKLKSLDDLLEIRPATQDPIEREDLLSFIDLLKQMLVSTPQERFTSAAALKHSFITMDHLSNFDSSSPYVLEAHEAMRTYKIMTPQRLGATSLHQEREKYNPEEFTTFCSEKQTSPSSNHYCVCSGNCASNSEKQGSASGSNIDGQCSGNCAPPTVNGKKLKEKTLNNSSETDYPGHCKDRWLVESCGGNSSRLCSRTPSSKKNIVIGSGLYTESLIITSSFSSETDDLKDESTTISKTNDQQPADCGNEQGKILTSPLKKGTIMTSSPDKKVVEIKKSKTVTFNPVIVIIPNQSQQEKIQSSLSGHSGFTVDSSLLKPNLEPPLFHKRLPASVSLPEQKQAQQLNTEEKLSKKSKDSKLHVQDNTSLTSFEDPSHLVEVKTRKKYWKRVKNFFSNMNWFGLCLPSKK